MREQLERRAFMVLLIIVSVLFLLVLEPYWGAIFWACAIAVIFYPVQSWLNRKIGNKPNTVALITLLLCMVIVVIPVLLIASAFVNEGVQLYKAIDSGDIDPKQIITRLQEAFPTVISLLERLGIEVGDLRTRIYEGATQASKYLASETLSFGTGTASFFISLSLMLYLAFFLLRDGNRLIDLMVKALPLGDERERKLFSKFAEVTRATVKGNLVVAIVQGTLGGIIFWILDIPAPLLWGVVMSALSLIPAVGAALVWLPVAIYLYALGDWVEGTVLVAYGAIIIGLADNVLRPLLVGRDTKLPDYIVLFSTIGGLALMGINGFVIGPLIAALFIVSWDIFMREFNADPDNRDNDGSGSD
ncbi:MAG: AI-2E family transporter [Idiomarina sp.]